MRKVCPYLRSSAKAMLRKFEVTKLSTSKIVFRWQNQKI
jgi:hypothetical protein